MNTTIINKSRNAVAVWFDQSKMFVRLDDGREIAIQIDWFPRLREASEKEKNNWRLIGGGEGIHWEDLDEDILNGENHCLSLLSLLLFLQTPRLTR